MANVRETIFNILVEYDRGGVRKPTLLKDALDKYDYYETRDKAFIKRVVEGCLEREIQIDYIIDSFSVTPVKKMQTLIRNVLRMSVYQIMFMDQVPDSAACNEAVKLVERHRFGNLKGFVNGVLRNIVRNKDSIKYPEREAGGSIKYLSVIYSMPEWICEMWVRDYGLEVTEKMLKFFLLPRPTTIRLNMEKLREIYGDSSDKTGNEAMDKYINILKDEGVEVKKSRILSYALDLEKTDNIRFLPGFEEGVFFVQDVSSMLVTEIADPQPGQSLLDVCAAPGGKSLHAAERKAVVTARDVSERKCDLIRYNAERMGIDDLTVECHDARIHDSNMNGKADILYLDLPCSGLGIIGRKNDIKYNASPKGLDEIARLQWDIIKTSWDYVKPGGTMIYSTCTVNKKENEDMVKRILLELPFEEVDISERLPKPLKSEDKGFIQLIPGEYDTDGFFIAKFKRLERKDG